MIQQKKKLYWESEMNGKKYNNSYLVQHKDSLKRKNSRMKI